MNIYSYVYRPLQDLIAFILLKKDLRNLVQIYLEKNNFDEIHDIGCSDGILAHKLDLKKTKYFGYDIELKKINKSKKKLMNNKNINFFYKSIDKINTTNKKKKYLF